MADAAKRLERLLDAARVLQNGQTPQGAALRARLRETTGLSAENIELGLSRCLETQPTEADVARLLTTPSAAHAHVLLSANVFVAAFRAIVLGAVSAPRLTVRASRREPALAEALHQLVPDAFELTSKLEPAPGDRYFAYGTDETLARVRTSLSPGVWFHAHGSGLGAVVLDAAAVGDADLRAVALDTALFDQRGCLSPRFVCVAGKTEQARAIAEGLAFELGELEAVLPRGRETPEEAAETRRLRDAAVYAFELFDAGTSWVSFSLSAVVPPPGRHLHVFVATDPASALAPFERHLTCVGTNSPARTLSERFAQARVVALGDMQRPPLDGPVDLRHGTAGELLS